MSVIKGYVKAENSLSAIVNAIGVGAKHHIRYGITQFAKWLESKGLCQSAFVNDLEYQCNLHNTLYAEYNVELAINLTPEMLADYDEAIAKHIRESMRDGSGRQVIKDCLANLKVKEFSEAFVKKSLAKTFKSDDFIQGDDIIAFESVGVYPKLPLKINISVSNLVYDSYIFNKKEENIYIIMHITIAFGANCKR